MSALQEIRTSETLGPDAVDLLIKLVGQVARTNSFPPRMGHASWSDQAVLDYVGHIFSIPQGKAMLTNCAVKAGDDEKALERLLLRSIRNRLIDDAKATPVGKLRRRMQKMLEKDERFVDAKKLHAGDDAWTIPANHDEIWTGEPDQLEELTRSVRVKPIAKMNPSGPTPDAVKVSLLTMSYEAISRAAGAIRTQVLARFLYRRFDLAGVPSSSAAQIKASESPSPVVDAPVLEFARQIYETLDEQDVALLARLEEIVGKEPYSDEVEDLFLRLRVYGGTEIGREAVGVVRRWCAGDSAPAS